MTIILKQCRTCHEEKPLEAFSKYGQAKDGHCTQCKACNRVYAQANKARISEYQVIYSRSRVEEKRAYDADYRARNGERLRAQSKEYYQQNRDAVIASTSEWQRNNPVAVRAKNKRWSDANPEKVKAAKAARYQANRDQHREYVRNRRMRIRKVGGQFTEGEFKRKLALYANRCHWCGRVIQDVHRDHLIPLAKGGTNFISNVVPSCVPCNMRKNALMPWDFQEGRLL